MTTHLGQAAGLTYKPGFLARRRLRRNCFHHDRVAGVTWIESQLIETGMRKMYWCINCGRVWIP